MAITRSLRWTLGMAAALIVTASATSLLRGQEPAGQPPVPVKLSGDVDARKDAQPKPDDKPDRAWKANAAFVAGLEAAMPKIESIRPFPAFEIPDNPPPHEGAMIDIPYVVQPPDIITVEVLEALAGRPITGERIVRPDGTISLGFYGEIKVRGLSLEQVKTKIVLHLRRYLEDDIIGLVGTATDVVDPMGKEVNIVIPPHASDRVFVDVAAYNSAVYSVEGDANLEGRFPWTGNETVGDVLHHAGGLSPTADERNVRLVRPGRNGKPAKIYPIDLAAIRDRGDTKANLQVFPGDRVVVSRKANVEATLKFNELVGRSATVISSLTNYANAMRALNNIGEPYKASTPGRPIDPEKRREAIKAWAEVLSGDPKVREEILKLIK